MNDKLVAKYTMLYGINFEFDGDTLVGLHMKTTGDTGVVHMDDLSDTIDFCKQDSVHIEESKSGLTLKFGKQKSVQIDKYAVCDLARMNLDFRDASEVVIDAFKDYVEIIPRCDMDYRMKAAYCYKCLNNHVSGYLVPGVSLGDKRTDDYFLSRYLDALFENNLGSFKYSSIRQLRDMQDMSFDQFLAYAKSCLCEYNYYGFMDCDAVWGRSILYYLYGGSSDEVYRRAMEHLRYALGQENQTGHSVYLKLWGKRLLEMTENFREVNTLEARYAMLYGVGFKQDNGVVTGIMFNKNASGVVYLEKIASEFNLEDGAIVWDSFPKNITLVVGSQVEKFHCSFEALNSLIEGLEAKIDLTDARDEIIKDIISYMSLDMPFSGRLIGDARFKCEVAGHLLADDAIRCVGNFLTDASVEQMFLEKYENALVIRYVMDKYDKFMLSGSKILKAVKRCEKLSDFKESLGTLGLDNRSVWVFRNIKTVNMNGDICFGLNRQIRYFVSGGSNEKLYLNLRNTAAKMLS